ncbi:thiamine pyrophosphate-binding protein [Candidatus Pelagibacter sp.]|nr:thiamine pyrophosphate-binding protein [Candidatus Pelagibacter sp.]
MKTASDLISKELRKNGITDIFMLTGYGAMYLNDSIQRNKINFYAARNEAAAPMMAEAYAKIKNKVGAVCVTAGPGATNALPGLAEAFVDSSPVIIISGQVERIFSADSYRNLNIRTLGTAEFSIIRAVKKITKYSKTITNEKYILYEVQKALHICRTGRPGPVWLEIPLDIQSKKIEDLSKLKKFNFPKKKKKIDIKIYSKIYKRLLHSKRPLLAIGNGLKQSGQIFKFKKLLNILKIPFITTRFAIDLIPYSNKYNMGLCGIKGMPYNKKICTQADFVLSLGCRFSPTFCFGNPKSFLKNAFVASVNNDKDELNLNLKKIDLKINYELDEFLNGFIKYINKKKKNNYQDWLAKCTNIKKKNQIKNIFSKKNPIDLYRFMYLLGKKSPPKSILITDAGSNYYIGGQVWHFEKGQREIASTTNAAMGLSLPLSVGAAIADKKNFIISVTGDGSIELNIQELKTISHYNLNIKTFVINNGGYISMKNWQDNFFSGNRLDTKEKTGAGTLKFENIAKAFELNFARISKEKDINKILSQVFSNNKPYLVEVMTDNNQKIYGDEL